MGTPEGKRTLGKPRCKWVEIINMDLREMGLGGVDWIDLAQDREVDGSCEHDNELSGSKKKFGKFLSSCKTGGF
jgi:hypothetical protein